MQEATRILYIDDSKEDRGLIFRSLFITHGGFRITEVTSKQELDARLTDGEYDLILSDIGVFGFDGLEVIDFIQGRKPHTPIIVVTGSGSEEIAVEAMKRGVSDYVVKTPDRLRFLSHAIQVAIDRSRPAYEQTLALIERRAQARQQEIVARLGQQALAGLDLKALMKVASTLVADTLALPYCCILEGPLPDGSLLLRAGFGWPPGQAGRTTLTYSDDDLVGYTLRTRRPVLIDDFETERRFTPPDQLGLCGIVSGVGIAICGKEGPLGILFAFSPTHETFTLHNVNFLLSVAHVLATAIERKQFEQDLVLAKENAVEMNRLKSAFLTNMSHEIRTPLTSIIGFASILASEVSSEHGSLIHLIEQSGHRLLGTLNAVLDLSMLEAGALTLNPEPLNLAQEVQSKVAHFYPMAAQKGLHLQFTAEGKAPTVFLDRSCLDRVLHNLISNAIKFTQEGGVTVKVGATDDRVEIAITDTGIGISEDFQPYLFDAFKQESMGMARSHEGAGLGLAVTRGFVDLMEGQLRVTSEKDAGSTFVVSFKRQEVPQGSEPARQAGGTTTSIPFTQLPVLIVEDSEESALIMKRFLEGLYKVDWVQDKKTTMQRVRRHSYALILLDINLGQECTGEDVLLALRQIPGCETVPIVAITAYAMPGDRAHFLEQGFDDYLGKPFTRQQLHETINRALQRVRPFPSGQKTPATPPPPRYPSSPQDYSGQ